MTMSMVGGADMCMLNEALRQHEAAAVQPGAVRNACGMILENRPLDPHPSEVRTRC